MNAITFDTQATVHAKSHFDAYQQRLQDERQVHAMRRDTLAACLDTCRGRAAEMSGFPDAGEYIWSASGLGGVLCQCQVGRGELEQIKSECLVTIQDLCDLLPGPAAVHFQHHSDAIQAHLAAAFEGYLTLEGFLAPPNLSELIASPCIALGEFERLTLLLGNAIVACGAFAEYLSQLIVDEIEIVQCLDQRLANVTTPVGVETLPATGPIASHVSSHVSSGYPQHPKAGMPAPRGALQPHLVRPRMIAGHGLTPSGGIAAGNASSEPTAHNDQEGDWLGDLAVAVTGLVTMAAVAVIAVQVVGSAKQASVDSPGNDAHAGAQHVGESVPSGAEAGTMPDSAEDNTSSEIAGIYVGLDVSLDAGAGIGVEIVADTATKLPFLGSAGGTAI